MEIPGLVVIIVVAVVLIAFGVGAWTVWSSSGRGSGDGGAFSADSQTKGDFAAFGTTIDGGGSDEGGRGGDEGGD